MTEGDFDGFLLGIDDLDLGPFAYIVIAVVTVFGWHHFTHSGWLSSIVAGVFWPISAVCLSLQS